MHSLKSEVKVMDSYNVQLHWDDEAKVWWTSSEDIPGLLVEADDIDGVIKEACLAASVLVEMDNVEKRGKLNFLYEREEKVIYD